MDFKRMVREKKFYAAILIAFAGILLGSTCPDRKEGEVLACGTFLRTVSNSLKSRTVLFFLPIAAVLPCGEEYLRERQGKFLRFLVIRRGKKEYCCDKVFTTSVSGALVWAIASLLGMLFFFLLFFAYEEVWSCPKEVVKELFAVLGRVCLEASALASLSAVLGTVSGSSYVSLGLPFVLYYSLVILRERYLDKIYAIDPAEWIIGQNDWAGEQRGLWIFLLLLAMGVAALHWVVLEKKLEEI